MYMPVRGTGAARGGAAGPYGRPEPSADFAELLEGGVPAEVVTLGSEATGAVEEGSWTCKGCGNLNYKHRKVCNTKKCSLPRYLADAAVLGNSPDGSWICPGCSNVNYPSRTVCNTKKCQMPHPGGTQVGEESQWLRHAGVGAGMSQMLQQQQHHQQWGLVGMPPQWAAAAAQPIPGPYEQLAWLGTPALQAMPAYTPMVRDPSAPAGSWECVKCGNLNYPDRELCNTRKCRAPRPPGAGKGALLHKGMGAAMGGKDMFGKGLGAGMGMSMAMGGMGGMLGLGMGCMGGMGGMGMAGKGLLGAPVAIPHSAAAAAAAAPGIQLEQAQDGEAPAPAETGSGGSSGASWDCLMCGNNNYGFRTVCNTRKCQAPRPY